MASRPRPPGLRAAYSFNEGSGTTVADASGTGNAGTIGTATWTTQGKFGNALSFNGTSARVTVPDASSLDLTTAMTLEAWVNPTALGGWRDVVYKANDVYFLEGSTPSAGNPPSTGGTFGGEIVGQGGLALNTWSHLAGDLRRQHHAPVRERGAGRLQGTDGADPDLHPAADDRRRPDLGRRRSRGASTRCACTRRHSRRRRSRRT